MKSLPPIKPPRRPITDPVKLLIWARKLLSDKRRWCKGAFWRDGNHRRTDTATKVVQCCAMGALALGSHGDIKSNVVYLGWTGLPKKNGQIFKWNDARSTTHAALLAGFDAAIKEARRRARAEGAS